MDRLLIFLIVIWKPHGEEGNRVYFLSCFAAFFFFFSFELVALGVLFQLRPVLGQVILVLWWL